MLLYSHKCVRWRTHKILFSFFAPVLWFCVFASVLAWPQVAKSVQDVNKTSIKCNNVTLQWFRRDLGEGVAAGAEAKMDYPCNARINIHDRDRSILLARIPLHKHYNRTLSLERTRRAGLDSLINPCAAIAVLKEYLSDGSCRQGRVLEKWLNILCSALLLVWSVVCIATCHWI